MISAHSLAGSPTAAKGTPFKVAAQGLQSEPYLIYSRGTPLLGPLSTRPPCNPQRCGLPKVTQVSSTGPTRTQASQPQPPICSPFHHTSLEVV